MMSEHAPAEPVPLSARLQILSTEHWSLLATRTMIWNESFTRAGMFLTVLSATFVALALIAQATDFDDSFRLFALLVLPVVLILGVGTMIRLVDIQQEDARLIAGMNRIRHGYLDIAPDIRPYFVTSSNYDLRGILMTFGQAEAIRPSRVLASTPVLVGIVNSLVSGAFVALVLEFLGASAGGYVAVGVAVGIAAMVLLIGVVPYREISGFTRDLRPLFPTEPD